MSDTNKKLSDLMSKTAWHIWWMGDCEAHIVPEVERGNHRPAECWCGPTFDLMQDGVLRVTHRLYAHTLPLDRSKP